MHNPVLIAVPLVGVAAGVAGLVLGLLALVVGWRGRRVDDHPVCRRCGFDLFGRPAESTACPECGANLARRRAVRIGRRQRRRGLLACGAVLLLVSFVPLGAIGVRRARGFEWQAHKPARWLLRELDSSDTAVRDAARAELMRRGAAGALDGTDVPAELWERALAAQADTSKPWDDWWGGVIENARMRDRLPQPLWERYVRQAYPLELKVAPSVRRGEPLPFGVAPGRRRAGKLLDVWKVDAAAWQLGPLAGDRPRAPRIEGTMAPLAPFVGNRSHAASPLLAGRTRRPAPTAFPGANRRGIRLRELGVFTPHMLDALGDGEHELRLNLELLVRDLRGVAAGRRWRTERIVVPVAATVTLNPTEFVALEQDATRAAALHAAVRVVRCAHGPPRQAGAFLVAAEFELQIAVAGPAEALACRVFVRRGPELWEVGTLACEEGARRTITVMHGALPDVLGDRCDVVLRPSVTVARSAGLMEAWGGELVFRDVPIERPKPAAAE